ncbi:UBN2_3 domain-containing protein [Senna tora]|uniref:UBN2_3 domain-containing protein n=1 Tax=Senna tora TaxID=362788 RepID=A0A834SPG5_9FABA|nr:UBN2_3 domain-containing protein [Senna tora]
MAAKSIIPDLKKGDKLNGNNYDILHWEFQFLLEEQEVIEDMRDVMVKPNGERPTQQVRRDTECYRMCIKALRTDREREYLSD